MKKIGLIVFLLISIVLISHAENKNRELTMYGVIDYTMSVYFESQLADLDKESHEPITIFINSPGGDVEAGLWIIDSINRTKSPIVYKVTGMVASMAAVILANGKKGSRFATEHAVIMIHDVSITLEDKYKDVVNAMKRATHNRLELFKILSKATGKSIEVIKAECAYDHYFTTEEAIQFGLVDAVY